jgi:hypothetical protein
MYWPIGAPRIYAASKHELDPKQTTTSLDGLEAPVQVRSPTPSAPAGTNGTATHDNGGDEDDGQSVEYDETDSIAQSESAADSDEKLAAPETSESTGASPHAADDDPGGEIVGLKVTRSGHMFATITQATLTVWQTKVVAVTLPILHSANSRLSPQLLLLPFSAQQTLSKHMVLTLKFSCVLTRPSLSFRLLLAS